MWHKNFLKIVNYNSKFLMLTELVQHNPIQRYEALPLIQLLYPD